MAKVNRRRFLAMLSSGALGAMTLDVDKLLWVQGAKTFFLPSPSQNTLLGADWFTRESLRLLERALRFDTVVARIYATDGVRVGDRVTVPDRAERLISHIVGVDVEAPGITTNRADYAERVLAPAAEVLAAHINHLRPVVFGELPLPEGVAYATRATSKVASVRGCIAFDITTDRELPRLDVVTG